MKTSPRSVPVVVAFVAILASACSAEVATPIPDSDGYLAGGNPAPTSQADAGTASTPPAGGGSQAQDDAGSTAPPTYDAGAPADAGAGFDAGGYSIDSGGAPDAAQPPTQGPLGTCGNPACATDGNECGCQATDSAGNTVQIGCQAGGECVCVVDQQVTGNPFDENGACSDQAATAAQFMQYCTCQ